MDRSLAPELHAALGAARATLAELVESGLEGPLPERAEAHLEVPLPEPAAARPAVPEPVEPAAAGPAVPAPAKPAAAGPAVPAPAKPAAARAAVPAPAEPTPPEQEPMLEPAAPVAGRERPSLETVRADLGECTRCGLCRERSQIVFGDGRPDAELMFIGEGPGEQEDRTGLPFVGRAGELLTRMIERGIEIPRAEVYICNIVKCRPPGNRTPLPDEVGACRPFLDAQIDAVRPRVIVTLGKPASSLLLGRDIAITRVRGTWNEYRGIPVMPTFHPAFVLRQYTQENRRLVWEDLKAAKERAGL